MNLNSVENKPELDDELLNEMTPDDYQILKKFVQKETKAKLFRDGLKIEELNAEKNKKIKNHFRYIMKRIEEDFEMHVLTSYYTKKAIFDVILHNALIPDDNAFLDNIEEARAYGCLPEHMPQYLQVNYSISKNAFNRKIEEFQKYYASYDREKQRQIEQALKSTNRLVRKPNNRVINDVYRVEKKAASSQPYDSRNKEFIYNKRA